MFSKLFRRKSIEHILREAGEERMKTEHGASLKRTLRTMDLTAFGIAAIIGSGIFATVGQAAFHGGPAVSLLFVFIAIACGFTAFCYAEFASMIPISGSAYTYAYASFGELIAWIIGWDLLLEYAIGNIAIAISWSDYFTGFLSGLGIRIPEYMTMDFLTAMRGHNAVQSLLEQGQTLSQIFADQPQLKEAYGAWVNAPLFGSIHFVADIPALLITVLTTWLIYVGIKESRNANNIMVALKLVVILAVIVIGFFYVDPGNWSPFAPNGVAGVLKGVAAVFWAFIGFDAISTTAEECQNPQRDLPRAILYTLAICAVCYVLISFVLTGIVSYKELNVGDPLAYIFKSRLPWLSGIIAFSAIFVIASVFLVFQLGQPRIWMSMSRDGLLPPIFSHIHPKHKTPSFSTIVTGLLVAIPALFMNLKEVIDLSSIGTLFAFVLVCGGVLVLENSSKPPTPKFKTPYVNGRYIVPVLYLAVLFVLYRYFKKTGLNDWDAFKGHIPMILFVLVATIVTVFSFLKRLSLIPVLGLLTCFYLMTELGITNWMRFGIWLVVGLVIYFLYGRKASRLNLAA
jgi:APA family basic amino acid/polyamine antiporter